MRMMIDPRLFEEARKINEAVPEALRSRIAEFAIRQPNFPESLLSTVQKISEATAQFRGLHEAAEKFKLPTLSIDHAPSDIDSNSCDQSDSIIDERAETYNPHGMHDATPESGKVDCKLPTNYYLPRHPRQNAVVNAIFELGWQDGLPEHLEMQEIERRICRLVKKSSGFTVTSKTIGKVLKRLKLQR